MNVIVTRDCSVSKYKLKKADECFDEAIKAIAAGEPTVISTANYADDHLLRVLIVDDHRATAKTLSSLVAIWGHDVRLAYDGVTGLALAAAYKPDVLLLDMLMPDVSGFEVAEQVRRHDRLKQCFIIGVTGRTDAKHRSRCYDAGVDLFLIKPVAPAHLQTLLSLESERVRRLNDYVPIAKSCRELTATY